MEPIRLSTQEAVLYVMLINAGIGLVFGLIPLALGLVKKNTKYGIYGIVTCIIGGAAIGIFASIPAAVIFSWLIIRKAKPAEIERQTPTDLSADNPDDN
jgi:hypothetical protein